MISSLASFPLVDCLRLIRSENVGSVTFFGLLRQFGSPAEALEAIPGLARQGGKSAIKLCSREQAEKEIEAVKAFGARLIRYGEPEYPKLLMEIYDPPPVITVRGDLSAQLPKLMLAIVGARNASANGFHFAQRLAQDAGKQGLCIVSGLARGIDTGAHKGSLATGTVAVIAGGIDHIYPPENEGLFKSIAEQGAIITEHPFGMAPHAKSFPARNRIISGMSSGTLIVEASLKSGSLITARCAAEQNREVFAVPGSPLDPRCKGTNELLRNGAILTEGLDDILSQLRAPALLREQETEEYQQPISPKASETEVAEIRLLVTEKLSPHPVSIDELLQQCHTTPPVLWNVLLELELAGKAQRHPGNKVSLRIEG